MNSFDLHLTAEAERQGRAGPSILIEVHFDFICPWCLIGKRNLEAAIRQLAEVRPIGDHRDATERQTWSRRSREDLVSHNRNGAEVILELLRTNGVDCIFASPIAVMAPLWEALAARRERGEPVVVANVPDRTPTPTNCDEP